MERFAEGAPGLGHLDSSRPPEAHMLLDVREFAEGNFKLRQV